MQNDTHLLLKESSKIFYYYHSVTCFHGQFLKRGFKLSEAIFRNIINKHLSAFDQLYADTFHKNIKMRFRRIF